MPAKRCAISPIKRKTFVKIYRCILVQIFLFSIQHSSAQILKIEKIHCSLSKSDAVEINKIVRYEASFYNAVFDTEKNDSLVVNVHIFGRKEDFRQTPDGENVLHVSSDGYFMENTGDVFVLKTDHLNSALLHEVSHAFLHHNFNQPPNWFDEGMATYLGSLVVQNGKIFYTPETERIERIRELNEKGNLHLSDFLNSKGFWHGSQQDITDQYTIAYSIIYFFIKTNLNLVKQMAGELKNGQSPNVILARMFGGFEFFQSKYISFYKQQN